LYIENLNVNFKSNRVRVDFDRDRHVEFFRIFNKMNQFKFDQNKHKFMSNRSAFTKLVHFFEISTIFIDVFFVNQYIDVVNVFEKARVRVEFVVHFE
jgi:hypothetical protein